MNKKLLLIVGGAIALIVILAIVASLNSGAKNNTEVVEEEINYYEFDGKTFYNEGGYETLESYIYPLLPEIYSTSVGVVQRDAEAYYNFDEAQLECAVYCYNGEMNELLLYYLVPYQDTENTFYDYMHLIVAADYIERKEAGVYNCTTFSAVEYAQNFEPFNYMKKLTEYTIAAVKPVGIRYTLLELGVLKDDSNHKISTYANGLETSRLYDFYLALQVENPYEFEFSTDSSFITKYDWIVMLSDRVTGITPLQEGEIAQVMYNDVDPTNEYYDYLDYMIKANILDGEGNFDGDQIATNKFIGTTIMKYLGKEKVQEYLGIIENPTEEDYLKVAYDLELIDETQAGFGQPKDAASRTIAKAHILLVNWYNLNIGATDNLEADTEEVVTENILLEKMYEDIQKGIS